MLQPGRKVKEREKLEIILGDDDLLSNSKKISQEDLTEIMKEFNNFKTSKLTNIKNDLKNEKNEYELKNKLQTLIDITKKKISNEDLIFVTLQIIEDTIYMKNKEHMNAKKLSIAVEILSPLLNCDEDTLKHLIKLTCKTLKRTTFLRRNKHRLIRLLNFFLNCLYKAK